MSEAHNEHESVIKTPKQLIAAVVAGFLVPIVCIILLVMYATAPSLDGAGSTGQSPEAIADRLRPVADYGFTLVDANAPKVLQAGADVYKLSCVACHGAGVAGAPATGKAGDWAARLAQGYDTLVKHAIDGLNAMPPKGGNPNLDDVEVARAVVYMANQSGASFAEPEVKPEAEAEAAEAETPAEAAK